MSTAPLQPRFEPARIIIVMGVSSSGKSTVGKATGRALHAPFLDGDGFHPPENVEKMRAGIPLTDADRWPWLAALARGLREAADPKGVSVGACSALKRAYRDFLVKEAGEPILFVYLKGTPEIIGERIAQRKHEYMPASLLGSQFATLEEPDPATENVLTVAVTDTVATTVATVTRTVDHLKSFKRKQ